MGAGGLLNESSIKKMGAGVMFDWLFNYFCTSVRGDRHSAQKLTNFCTEWLTPLRRIRPNKATRKLRGCVNYILETYLNAKVSVLESTLLLTHLCFMVTISSRLRPRILSWRLRSRTDSDTSSSSLMPHCTSGGEIGRWDEGGPGPGATADLPFPPGFEREGTKYSILNL